MNLTKMLRRGWLPSILQLVIATVSSQASGQTTPWVHFTLSGGPSLDFSTYVYDSNSNRMIVFGGSEPDGVTCTSDTWFITHANGIGGAPQWVKAPVNGPPPPARARASGVYDQANNRMIMFGGGAGPCGGPFSVLFNDTWVLSNANGIGGVPTWTLLNPPASLPAGRAEQGAVYDPNFNTMTIFGGCNDGIMDVPNDVWVLENANGLGGQQGWTQLAPTGALPAPRCSPVVTYNSTIEPASSVMTVFGGCCPSLGDLWILTGGNGVDSTAAWRQLAESTPAPAARETGAFGYDNEINTLMFFGGYSYPGPEHYNDTWMLTHADDSGGEPTWFNTIPDNIAGSPTAGNDAFGGYDSTSKRLMAMQGEDPTDLWVMTTRNGIDVSCSSKVPTSAQLSQLQRDGILFAVVKAPQTDGGTVECSGQVETAQQQLDAFNAAGFKTAAYCFLNFSLGFGSGKSQADNCLNTITTSGADLGRLNQLSFIALDVEGASTLTPAEARMLISQAAEAITAAPKFAIIYTDPGAWKAITGTGYGDRFSSYPLWLFTGGVPSLTPFPLAAPFYGWTSLSGKQYKQNATISGVSPYGPVDFDVFDPALFPNP